MDREFKNSAFTGMFTEAAHLVDLYEFVSGRKVDIKSVEPVKLHDGLEKERLYNDASFLTRDNRLLIMIEHQSTLNKGIVFRMLEYYVRLVDRFIIKRQGQDKYGNADLEIPQAEFFVVFNGKMEMVPLLELDLGDVRVNAQMHDIRFDSLEIEDKNNAVLAYARYVEIAHRDRHINDVLDQMMDEGYLVEYFNRKEIREMFAETFSYDNELRWEERQKTMAKVAKSLLSSGMLVEEISKHVELPYEAIEELVG